MDAFFSLISAFPYIDIPKNIEGWVWLCILFGLQAGLFWNLRGLNKALDQQERIILIGLTLLIPLTSLLIGLRIRTEAGLSMPEIPRASTGISIVIFSAVPWMLAGGLLGPGYAMALAFLSGVLRTLWDTHSPFTPFEIAILAGLFSYAVNQRYRTVIFKWLRRPIVAALILSLLYPIAFLINSNFLARGALVSRLDYALTHLAGSGLAMAIELLLAGAFCEVIAATFQANWGSRGLLLPSPAEKSLQARLLSILGPFAVIMVLVLIAGDWLVAGNAARGMIRSRLATISNTTAESVPYFLDAGQNLILQLASDPQLNLNDPARLPEILSVKIKTVPYFQQFFVLDLKGKMLASYPEKRYEPAPLVEQMAFQLAVSGVPVQSYAIEPEEESGSAQISFIAPVMGNNSVRGVLIGRSDISMNPIIEPVLNTLDSLAEEGGQGLILDETGKILYHQDPSLIMRQYTGKTSELPSFFDDTAPDGTRQLVYYQRALGRPWSVVLIVPAVNAQGLALRFALPLLVIIAALSLITIGLLKVGLGTVTGSLRTLAKEADLISQGQLSHALPSQGDDEVGHLRRSFERMRISLKARLDELNR